MAPPFYLESHAPGKAKGMFKSVEDVKKRFEKENYICSRQIATAVYLADRMERPLLVEGPAGVGKTESAKVLASALGLELIRLQCYEGLDETKALYEWEYAKQLLYTQILKEKIGEFLADCDSLKTAVERISREEDVFFSEAFILPRPLLKAILSKEPTVLLIDEVDKSDPEFEAFLLEILSDFQISVPELGTISARHIPRVILTSNSEREMTDTLKRRCLHLYIDYPSMEQELRIVRRKVPGISESLARQVVSAIETIRTLDLKKTPSLSETLDWAKALVILNAEALDVELIRDTLNLVLKYEGDIAKAEEEIDRVIQAVQKT